MCPILRGEFGKRTLKDTVSGDRAQIMDILTATANPLANEIGIEEFTAIPISGFRGDNITAAPSGNTPWYDGPSLIHHLESVDLANTHAQERGFRMPVFGVAADKLAAAKKARESVPAPYYLRMMLQDKPGTLAKIATILGENGISIDRMRQYGHEDASAPVLIVTHRSSRTDLDAALEAMAKVDVLEGEPVAIRIEEL